MRRRIVQGVIIEPLDQYKAAKKLKISNRTLVCYHKLIMQARKFGFDFVSNGHKKFGAIRYFNLSKKLDEEKL